MGWMRHHAIIVTGWNRESIDTAHSHACKLFRQVSNIVESPINSHFSFLVAPDGSKEGWRESENGDKAREDFKQWLRAGRGFSPPLFLDWCEVQYGDDYGETKIIASDDDDTELEIAQ